MEEKRRRVYMCEDSLEGILTAVYEAYHSRYGHHYIRIDEEVCMNYDLFSDYIPVVTDFTKAESVAMSIRKKISYQSWMIVLYSALSNRKGKAQDIYRFLNYGYELGGRVVDCLGEDHIRRVIFDKKTVGRELDRMMGITRFTELKDGSLVSKICPKHNLVPILAPHFADRLPEERWIIFDENRKLSAVHVPDNGWYMVKGELNDFLLDEILSKEEQKMRNCWKTFFDSIAIESRINLKLQQQMLPKYYQRCLTKSGDKCFD